MSSSSDGTPKLTTRQPRGLTADSTCLIVPSLPAASMAWKISSRPQVLCANIRSWISASRTVAAASRASASVFPFTPAESRGLTVLSDTRLLGLTRSLLKNSIGAER